MAVNSNKQIWFPAKKYGWGWGPPVTWQGWLVTIIYIILVTLGGVLFARRLGLFIPYMIGVSAIFIAVVWLKGEKLRWRWGDK